MTLVKICGITNLEDALCAVDAGAGALGFNFYLPSPRYIDPVNARRIIEKLPKNVLTVGVFVNEEPERLKSIATEAGVSALQLHGDESAGYCAELKDWYVIKAFSVGDDFNASVVVDYQVKAVMIDARHTTLRGGTGLLSDWSVARCIRELGKPLFLAGGLLPDNVREAITVVKPYAVDACSGLEDSPGKKNQRRVAEFVRAVNES
ncbi:MAG TPA: phosphoribosylanthranilate isomerase [Pyrinomonadaceae bacterium]|jgi:phosphoribosylanthranilate isomerase